MTYLDDIIKLIDFIEDRLHEPLSLEEMAEYTNYSKFYMHRFFKAKTGMTLGDYVRQRRLAKGVEMLCNSAYSIEYISATLGFQHPTNFTRVFKQHYGLTPQRFHKERPEMVVTPRL